MSALRDYQRFAARCLQEARATLDSRHRVFLVEMAQAWRKLAEQARVAEGVQADTLNLEPDRGD